MNALRWLPAALLVLTTALPTSAHASGRTAVLLIGGINSHYLTTLDAFQRLSGALVWGNLGYQPGDVSVWSYDPAVADYDPSLTCQPIATNAAALADTLRWLRDSQGYSNVVLVGHSLGGRIAYEMVDARFEFVDQGFLKKIVTIDSPLFGVGSGRFLAGEAWFGADCVALNQLEWINQSFLAGRLTMPAPRGVPVLSIANQADNAVPFISQTANGVLGQHWDYTLTEGWGLSNHAATLHDASIMSSLAQWIGPQAQ
jgi:pimeloyl-ACP methyl ester carboxylesterase